MSQQNIALFERAFAYHAAAHHVLGLALTKCAERGIITSDERERTLAYAERNMDVGEVRKTVELALDELRQRRDLALMGTI